MKFKKYGSIENYYRQKTINHILESDLCSGEWVQLLKIHGANYSFSCDGAEVKRGKRSSFLGDEKFYGDHNFDYSENVMDLFYYLEKIFNCSVITVYGEIFGGVYNHPDVPKIAGFTKVQQQIHYCPENRFACFDIEVDGKPLWWDDVVRFCEMFKIPLVPELARGYFADLVQADVVFPDPLHKEFGLPTIENNDAEGWVLKPVQERRFYNEERVILKGRNPKFSDQNKVKKTPNITVLSDAGNIMKDVLISFINENRLKNVISHGDTITQKDFGKLMGLLSQDAFSDFLKDYKEPFELLELKEQNQVKKLMNKEAGDVIRPNFVDIIDGEFL